jgi:hypothetical protein
MNADIQCAACIRQSTKRVNGFGASMSVANCADLSVPTDDELQTRPRVIHGTHLDIHQSERKSNLPDGVLGDVGASFR